MKKILVLGAGRVAGSLIRYLLEQTKFSLIVATRTSDKAEKLIAGHPRGIAAQLDVEDSAALRVAISKADLVISLLPWTYHIRVAKLCAESAKHLVTTSYVKPEMKLLDTEVSQKGLIFLNEIGADPGIDHIAAMNIIRKVQDAGGEIVSFYSYCGGLPAPDSNTNPLGYKFSWSPSGVLLAANNDAQYLRNGKIIKVSGKKLFQHYWLLDVPNAGTFEAYPNRDALVYSDIYGIPSVRSIYRGTLRNIGHCETWDYFKKLGLLRQDKLFDCQKLSPRQIMAELIGSTGKNFIKNIARYLNIPDHSVTLKKLEWLGLFDTRKPALGKAAPFDIFSNMLQEKLVFGENERDMLIQHHEIIAAYPDGKQEKISSTLTDFGIAGGDSSMSRTVGLPAAIAAKLILEKKIRAKGVLIPVLPEIYEPVMRELEKTGIRFTEAVA